MSELEKEEFKYGSDLYGRIWNLMREHNSSAGSTSFFFNKLLPKYYANFISWQ